MTEERFIDLESRIAHQDQSLNELNEVVTEQQAKIMQLEELMRSLVDQVRAIGETLPAAGAVDERPPHY